MKKFTREELSDLIHKVNEVRKEAKLNKEFGFEDDMQTFLRKMVLLKTQMSGVRLQNRFMKTLGLQYVNPKAQKGDAVDSNGDHSEIKFTIIDDVHQSLSLVQIRSKEKVKHYYVVAIDTRVGIENTDYKVYAFKLSKPEMLFEMEKLGAQLAHGNEVSNEGNKNPEHRMDLPLDFSNENFRRWVNRYQIVDLDEVKGTVITTNK